MTNSPIPRGNSSTSVHHVAKPQRSLAWESEEANRFDKEIKITFRKRNTRGDWWFRSSPDESPGNLQRANTMVAVQL